MLKWLILSLLAFLSHGLQLPADVQRCRYANETCHVEGINYYIRTYSKGLVNTSLKAFDRLYLPEFTLLNSSDKLPVWLNWIQKDHRFRGFENASVTQVKGFERNPTKRRLIIEFRIPHAELRGSFKFQSRVIFFKLNGSGTFTSDVENVRVRLVLKAFVEYRKGRRHLRIYNLVPEIQMDRWILSLDNLCAENTDLTIALNRIYNEHWLELWNELEPNFMPAITKMGRQFLQEFLDLFAYDDFFLDH